MNFFDKDHAPISLGVTAGALVIPDPWMTLFQKFFFAVVTALAVQAVLWGVKVIGDWWVSRR